MTAKMIRNYLNCNDLFISLENPEIKSQPTGETVCFPEIVPIQPLIGVKFSCKYNLFAFQPLVTENSN